MPACPAAWVAMALSGRQTLAPLAMADALGCVNRGLLHAFAAGDSTICIFYSQVTIQLLKNMLS